MGLSRREKGLKVPTHGSVGSVATLPVVWNFADMTNALMAIPNLIALLALNRVIVAETKQYLWDEVGGKDMNLTPDAAGSDS